MYNIKGLFTDLIAQYYFVQDPETIQLGTNKCGQKDTFQYIPLLEGLRALISNPEIRNEV